MIKKYSTIPEMAEGLFAQLLNYREQLGMALHLSLSGGSTPKALFKYFRETKLDHPIWKEVHFWWGDERLVSMESHESNFGEAWRLFLKYLSVRENQIHSVKGNLSQDVALEDYRKEMELLPKTSEGKAFFHWLWLGMGDDGHTASIFPDFQQWESSEDLLLCKNPYNGQIRTSLTPKCIAKSRWTTFIVTGKAKAEVLKEIHQSQESAEKYPAYRISKMVENPQWVCDSASLSLLPVEPSLD